MRGLKFAVVGLFAGAVVITACGTSSTASTSPPAALVSGCSTGSGVTASTTTKSYVVRLDIGPLETMWTQAQAAAQHPTDGEIMISGTMAPVSGSSDMSGMGDTSTTADSMAGMPGMSGTSGTSGSEASNVSAHHLEAHICSRATGQPIQGANPTITVTPASTPNTPQTVPIAVMEGVNAGVADYHYGNNVELSAGAAYTVAVAINGETATFHVTLPTASSTGSSTTSTTGGSGGGANGM